MSVEAGPEPGDEVERRFDAAMFEIYERAGAELGYWATRYLHMLRRRGGLETARQLLAARTTSDGYARLREERRLDLTVEAHVLRPEFRSLFTARELERAGSRLAFYERAIETEQRAAKSNTCPMIRTSPPRRALVLDATSPGRLASRTGWRPRTWRTPRRVVSSCSVAALSS